MSRLLLYRPYLKHESNASYRICNICTRNKLNKIVRFRILRNTELKYYQLHNAAILGHCQCLKILDIHDPNLNKLDLLFCWSTAVQFNQVDIVYYLLELASSLLDADINPSFLYEKIVCIDHKSRLCQKLLPKILNIKRSKFIQPIGSTHLSSLQYYDPHLYNSNHMPTFHHNAKQYFS